MSKSDVKGGVCEKVALTARPRRISTRKGTVESYLCLISEEDAPCVVIRGSMLCGEPAKFAAKCEQLNIEIRKGTRRDETHAHVNQAFIGA